MCPFIYVCYSSHLLFSFLKLNYLNHHILSIVLEHHQRVSAWNAIGIKLERNGCPWTHNVRRQIAHRRLDIGRVNRNRVTANIRIVEGHDAVGDAVLVEHHRRGAGRDVDGPIDNACRVGRNGVGRQVQHVVGVAREAQGAPRLRAES